MKKRTKLKTALFLLAAATNMTYASESCVPPKKGQTPLDVLECLQKGLDTLAAKTEKQQEQIAELKQENQRLQQLPPQVLAGATCVALGPVSHRNFALKRACRTLDKTCAEVCASFTFSGRKTSCFNALYVRDYNDLTGNYELPVYKYGSSSGCSWRGRHCGPNYCCCSVL